MTFQEKREDTNKQCQYEKGEINTDRDLNIREQYQYLCANSFDILKT